MRCEAQRSDEICANCLFWFEFELRQYTSAAVDIEGLGKSKEKLILVAGEDSGDGPGVGPSKVLGGALQKDILRISGGYLGYVIDPKAFTSRLLGFLQ